jgi:hypothetical protein
MVYPGFSQEGTIDESAILLGSWSEVIAEVSGTGYSLGSVKEGVLEISKEYYMHEGTRFPRLVDLVIPVRTGMKFTGVLEEINNQNVSFLLGQTLAIVGSQQYIYVGALDSVQYFTFRGKRTRVTDSNTIEFGMWKCLINSIFSLGSGDEAQGSPLEVVALDDVDADYGGSATAPLGYIFVPAAGT